MDEYIEVEPIVDGIVLLKIEDGELLAVTLEEIDEVVLEPIELPGGNV